MCLHTCPVDTGLVAHQNRSHSTLAFQALRGLLMNGLFSFLISLFANAIFASFLEMQLLINLRARRSSRHSICIRRWRMHLAELILNWLNRLMALIFGSSSLPMHGSAILFCDFLLRFLCAVVVSRRVSVGESRSVSLGRWVSVGQSESYHRSPSGTKFSSSPNIFTEEPLVTWQLSWSTAFDFRHDSPVRHTYPSGEHHWKRKTRMESCKLFATAWFDAHLQSAVNS